MTDFNTLTEKVRWLMEQRQVSKRQFAIDMGIDPSNFVRKLSGSLPWTNNDVRKMVEKGVSLEWLKTGEGEPYTEQKKIDDAVFKVVEHLSKFKGRYGK